MYPRPAKFAEGCCALQRGVLLAYIGVAGQWVSHCELCWWICVFIIAGYDSGIQIGRNHKSGGDPVGRWPFEAEVFEELNVVGSHWACVPSVGVSCGVRSNLDHSFIGAHSWRTVVSVSEPESVNYGIEVTGSVTFFWGPVFSILGFTENRHGNVTTGLVLLRNLRTLFALVSPGTTACFRTYRTDVRLVSPNR